MKDTKYTFVVYTIDGDSEYVDCDGYKIGQEFVHFYKSDENFTITKTDPASSIPIGQIVAVFNKRHLTHFKREER